MSGKKRSRRSLRGLRVLGLVVSSSLLAAGSGCGDEFDEERRVPERGTLGQELYSLVCDRVGAQALREDVGGASYRDLCHPLSDGSYQTIVDQTLLPPLRDGALNVDGQPVPLSDQERDRAGHIARVEALSRRRRDLVRAFDQILPDEELVLQKVRKDDGQNDCGAEAPSDTRDRLLEQIADTLSRFVDLYNDETIPWLTRAIGRTLARLAEDDEVQQALARLDARQGYRPLSLALGVARPALAYPRLGELANTLLRLFAADSDPYNPDHLIDASNPTIFDNHTRVPGSARPEYQRVLQVLREELRTPTDLTVTPLEEGVDPSTGIGILNRPRTKLELALEILLLEDESFRTAPESRFLVRRDRRGVAQVNRPDGFLPAPFVDDGSDLPAIDELGQLVSADGSLIPAPFFNVELEEGQRDASGLALGASGLPLYEYMDLNRSYLSRTVLDFKPMLKPAEDGGNEVVLKLFRGLPVLLGDRDADPVAVKLYPPDGDRGDEYELQGLPVPSNLDQKPIEVKYRAYHPETSPMVDLFHALGNTLVIPEVDDALSLARKLLRENPEIVARLVKLGLELKAIADKFVDASVPENSTFWDEMLDIFIRMARDPDMLEQLIRAFGDQRTFELKNTFAAFMNFKDELTYIRNPNNPENYNSLNGNDQNGNQQPDGQRLFNLTTNSIGTLGTPVDRGQADTGTNRSALQRFIQLLHDVRGMSACTKDGSIVHLELDLQQFIPGVSAPLGTLKVDYPDDRLLTVPLCAFVGQPAPTRLPLCGMLRFPDVAELILDVALDRAEFDVRDPCLNALMNNQLLTGLVGGADAFLEMVSGIDGFTLQPTVEGISRMAFFQTPYNTNYGSFAGDGNYPRTRDFLKDVIDPIPTTVCPQLLGSDGQPWRDSDGTVMNLRVCDRFEDTMRGRDSNALFPLGEFSFISRIQPLASSFGDHDMNAEFVDLFDTMHLHWGSAGQTQEECDPGLPKGHTRWCSQDGLVSYEALLGEMLEFSDLFPALRDIVPFLETFEIDSCTQRRSDGSCAQTVKKGGIEVLGAVARALILPERSDGLTDARGRQSVTRNDGSENPQVTPMYLLIEAFKGIDQRFAQDTADSGSDQKHVGWREARSDLVDNFFTVDGNPTQATFRNTSIPVILEHSLSLLQAQVRAQCTDQGTSCQWARATLPMGNPDAARGLTANIAEVLSGPVATTLIDLVNAIDRDPEARLQMFRFVSYLLEQASANEANAVTLASLADLIQVMRDESNLEPVFKLLSMGAEPTLNDAEGQVVRRGSVDGMVEVLAQLFARKYTDRGDRLCSSALDPNLAIPKLLHNLVTPVSDQRPAPIETLISVIADVNRSNPGTDRQKKYQAADYGSLGRHTSDFFIDETTGLEQVYEIVRQATLGE